MATDYGWFQSQSRASPTRVTRLAAIEDEKITHRATAIREGENGKSNGNGSSKSFRSQDSILRKARAACSANSFSDRAVHFRCRIRLSIAMDETPWLGGCSLLQPAPGSSVHAPGSRHWIARMAVPT